MRRALVRGGAWAAFLASVLGLAGCDGGSRPPAAREAAAVSASPGAPPAPQAANPQTVERGRLLALQGNCAGCHTAPGGLPMAGGRPLPTPFGLAQGGNLTPDPDTGLGRWSADDFWGALHFGRGRDGRPLVPAFPYTSYTRVTREDSDAIFAYLRSLPAVRQANPPQQLRFPYGTSLALRLWQALFFEPADLPAEAAARAALTPSQARGAYLVQGLGHCGACHAPRNRFGAPAAHLRGADMPGQGWYAPSLHPAPLHRVPRDEQVRLLQVGQTDRASVLGPMAAVVFQSLQHWPEADLQAVVDYLATLPPESAPRPAEAALPDVLQSGVRLYAERCAECHGERGEGVPGVYPALAGNPGVVQPSVRNLVQVLRHGGFAPATAGQPRPYGMPPQGLTEAQAAAVLTAIRQQWGHQASAVTALEVIKTP